MKKLSLSILAVLMSAAGAPAAGAGVLVFGSENCLTTGCYGSSDPTAGATLQGLAPGVVTVSVNSYAHTFPFSPTAGDFPGTDQIYVGSTQTASHDGYSVSPQRINGPDVITLDYAALVGPGQKVATLVLGVAADDFQFPVFGQPFTATLNGVAAPALTTQLNSLNETGPVVQFFTIGLDPSIDNASHTLTLSIDEGGDGGDGWAVDFLTVGVTTVAAVPEPSTWAMMLCGLAALAYAGWRRRSSPREQTSCPSSNCKT